MDSRKWVKLFFILFLMIFISIVFIFYIFHDRYGNENLSAKECLIRDYKPKVIFAGDSRAERQLNPKIALDILNLDVGAVVNIAISSGDPIMIEWLINKYPDKFKDAIIIISISPNSINDNSIGRRYFSYSMISKLSFLKQVQIFLPNNIKTLFKYYKESVKYIIKGSVLSNKKDKYDNNFGFFGVDGSLDVNKSKIEPWISSPFYINYSDGGVKYKIIEKSLKYIKTKVKTLFVYTAPFAPSVIDKFKGTKLLDYELSFKNKIKTICIDNNITYENYLFLDELPDKYFYDDAHLNMEGAERFTEILLKDLKIY